MLFFVRVSSESFFPVKDKLILDRVSSDRPGRSARSPAVINKLSNGLYRERYQFSRECKYYRGHTSTTVKENLDQSNSRRNNPKKFACLEPLK